MHIFYNARCESFTDVHYGWLRPEAAGNERVSGKRHNFKVRDAVDASLSEDYSLTGVFQNGIPSPWGNEVSVKVPLVTFLSRKVTPVRRGPLKHALFFYRMDIAYSRKIVYNKFDIMCRRSSYPVTGMRGPG